ncbi:hypothetical protein AAGG49_22855, partial [Stenotrophomonas maltophilia]|uniref:hypothetical protein n=1 Tax=Stenotrophomonas maltophilia TaxID=40324 RepID=UPI00313AA3A0
CLFFAVGCRGFGLSFRRLLRENKTWWGVRWAAGGGLLFLVAVPRGYLGGVNGLFVVGLLTLVAKLLVLVVVG